MRDLTTPTIVCDLDGVIWLADRTIPGSPDAIARLRAGGHEVLFVTNNSFSPVGDVEDKLASMGIPAQGAVLTSAMAAVRLLEPGTTALVCGGPGVVQALDQRGVHAVRDGDADAVLVGFHRDFDYERLRIAAMAVRRGARLIGTNDDATYPTPDGPIPGGGSILAAVATGSGATPTVAGKPYQPMATLVRERVGTADIVMVGDRWDTDGLFALNLGCPFALVLTGVTADVGSLDPPPAYVGADLAAVATQLLA